MCIFFRYLDLRLEDWARWEERVRMGHEGWPPSSVLSIVLEVGVVIQNSQSKPPMYFGRAEEINCWLNRLSKESPKIGEAIKAYSLRNDETYRQVAKKLNVSLTTFNERVREAKNWLSKYIYDEPYAA